MENPTFKLEKVIRSQDEMEDFEGPLTLILQLLSKNKIEIQDIQISSLLDQYLAYLDEMKAMDLEIASEFVSMASHLVYIKTKMLLSAGEETTELEELIFSLEKLQNRDAYDRVREVIEPFADMYMTGGGMMTKPPEPDPGVKEYRYSHEPEDILKAMLTVLLKETEESTAQAPTRRLSIPKPLVYSVSDKSEYITKRLKNGKTLNIIDLFHEAESRSELVATFIAILELCHDGKIGISGIGEEAVIEKLI